MAKSRTPLKECSQRAWAGRSSSVELMAHLAPAVTLLATSPAHGHVRDCRKATPGDELQHLTRLLCKPVAESWGGLVLQATALGWPPR